LFLLQPGDAGAGMSQVIIMLLGSGMGVLQRLTDFIQLSL
jgi:hypothetical protein